MKRVRRGRTPAPRRWWSLVLALALLGCGGEPSGVDGGEAPDGGRPVVDAGASDGGGEAPDGGTAPCDPACGAGQSCLRGVCVASCGADAAALQASLGPDLLPVAHFCRAASAYAVRGGDVYDLTASTDGTLTTFTLSRWTLDVSTSTPSPELLSSPGADHGSGVGVFAGGYLALDGSTEAAFGYSTDPSGDGELFVVDTTDGSSTGAAAPQNFDAAWLDDATLLVNGHGLLDQADGQGVYAADRSGTPRAAKVVTDLYDYSGSVGAAPAFVLAGGTEDGTFATHVHAFSVAGLRQALSTGTPLSASSANEVLDPSGEPLPSLFSMLGSDRIVVTPFGGPLTSYAIAWDGSTATLLEPRVLATGGTFTEALSAPDDRVLLVHPAGLLLVEAAAP